MQISIYFECIGLRARGYNHTHRGLCELEKKPWKSTARSKQSGWGQKKQTQTQKILLRPSRALRSVKAFSRPWSVKMLSFFFPNLRTFSTMKPLDVASWVRKLLLLRPIFLSTRKTRTSSNFTSLHLETPASAGLDLFLARGATADWNISSEESYKSILPF